MLGSVQLAVEESELCTAKSPGSLLRAVGNPTPNNEPPCRARSFASCPVEGVRYIIVSAARAARVVGAARSARAVQFVARRARQIIS